MKQFGLSKYLFLVSTVILLVCLYPYAHVKAEGDDWVEIISLSPNHYENYEDEITFTATIRYSLQSKEQGIIYLGFNTEQADYYEVDRQEGDHVVVSKGEGIVTLQQTVTPVDWNSGIGYMQQFLNGRSELIKDFKVYANISEYPHDIPWIPLAIFEAVVNELPEDSLHPDIFFGESDDPNIEHFDSTLENLLALSETTEYNPQLAHMLIALCNSVHDKDNMRQSFANMGFNDVYLDYLMPGQMGVADGFVATINEDPMLVYAFAKKELADGTTLVLVVTRGTASLEEGVSNFDITELFGKRHKGFLDAANGLEKSLEAFLGTNDLDQFRFVLTGHSRGAAATNLLAADLIQTGVSPDKLVAYNFACPDVEIMTMDKAESEQYSSIFNIANANDFVSWVPSSVWESGTREKGKEYWNKYGCSYWFAEDWDDEYGLVQKFPGNVEAIINRINSYHLQGLYLDFLSREKELIEYKQREETTEYINRATQKKKDAAEEKRKKEATEKMEKFWQEYRLDCTSVFCPVDIEVYNAEGELLGYTAQDFPVVKTAGKGCIAIFAEEDRKRVFVENLSGYKIVVTGRSEGTMFFEVQTSYDGFSFEKPTLRCENVQIAEGKTFCWVNSEENGKLLLIDTSNDDKEIAEIQADGLERILTKETSEEISETSSSAEKEEVIKETVVALPEESTEAISNTEQSTEEINHLTDDGSGHLNARILLVLIICVSGLVIFLVVAVFLKMNKREKKTR